MYQFSFEKFGSNFGPILSCLPTTLFLAFATFACAFVLACLIAFLSMRKNRAVTFVMKIWLSLFRGTPILVQLFFFVYGVFPNIPFMRGMSPIWYAIICLSLAYSAYMSETIRGAIASIPGGQMEACLTVGMSHAQGMRRVILPQAMRLAIPPLSNNFMEVFKGASLASIVGVTEMLLKAKMISSKDLRMMESYLAVLLIYWALSILFTFVQKRIEDHMAKHV